MLYNQKWDKSKTDPLALTSLIAWLEQQPVDGIYEFGCGGHCLIAQYFKQHCGLKRVFVGRTAVWLSDKMICDLPPHWDAIACGSEFDCSRANRSYGAALTRARTVLIKESQRGNAAKLEESKYEVSQA